MNLVDLTVNGRRRQRQLLADCSRRHTLYDETLDLPTCVIVYVVRWFHHRRWSSRLLLQQKGGIDFEPPPNGHGIGDAFGVSSAWKQVANVDSLFGSPQSQTLESRPLAGCQSWPG